MSDELYAVYAKGDKLYTLEIGTRTAAQVDGVVGGNWYGVKAASPGRAVQEALVQGFDVPNGAIFAKGDEEVINLGKGIISYYSEPSRGGSFGAKGALLAPIR